MNSSLRIVLIIFLLCLLGGMITGTQFYYRLAYFWILLIVISWAYSRVALRGVSLERNARVNHSHVGQIFEERFEIHVNSRIPRFWLEIVDQANLPGSRGSQVLSMLRGKEVRKYSVRTRLTDRGVFNLGPTSIASGDIFGLFPVIQSYPIKDSLLVYPMMAEITAFPSPVGWLSGGEAIRRRTQQITANASGVREYAPGDPLNRIHWLSTARKNTLIVKEFELDPMSEVWLFVDSYEKVQASLLRQAIVYDERDKWRPTVKIPLPPSTEEYAVTIAASLARYYLQRERILGLVSAGQQYSVLPAEKGVRQLGKILETLALLKAIGRLPLQSLVEAQINNLPRGSTVVLITPDGGDRVIISVELLVRRGMHPITILLDAESFGGHGGTTRLVQQLELLGIPFFQIKNGDDLSAALSQGNSRQIWM